MRAHYPHIISMSIFISWLFISSLYAQDSFIKMSFSTPKVTMKNGEVESLTVKIENGTANPFSGEIFIRSNEGVSIISKENQKINLAAGSSRYITVQLFIEKSAQAGEKRVVFRLDNAQKVSIIKEEVPLTIIPVKLMLAEVLTTTTLLPATGSMLEIPVRISNGGNTDQKINIIVSFPFESNEGSSNSHTLFLSSYADTIINISKKITPYISRQEELKVNIIGMYANGDFFSSQALTFYSPKSHSRFRLDQRRNDNWNQNQVTLGIMNLGSTSEAYYLRGNTTFQSGKTKGSAQLDIVNWPNKLSVQNSWVELEHKNIGARLGSIMKYEDVSLYGRGAEVFFKDSASNYTVSAGYIDKTYDLFNNNRYNIDMGQAAWLFATKSIKHGSLTTMLVSDRDSYSNSVNKIIINSASLRINNNWTSNAKFGFGHSQNIKEPSESRPSFLIAGSLSGNLSKNVFIHSDNSYATAYFPGIIRGVISINQQANLKLNERNLWVNYRFYNFSPSYFQSGTQYSYQTSTHAGSLGTTGNFGTFQYSVGPYYTKESGNWNWFIPNDKNSLESLKLSGNLNWVHGRSKQYFSLQFEAGQSRINSENSAELQLKGMINWSYKAFRLSASAQKGTFYLQESYYRLVNGKPLVRYQVSPTFSKSFFRNKLHIETSMNYMIDRSITNTFYSGRVNYDLRNTRLFAIAQFGSYNRSSLYQNFQVGITQRLPSFSQQSVDKPGDIDIFIFKDINGNGIFDKTDSIASGHLVNINNKLFVTDQKGRVTYKKLPKGTYAIDAPVHRGWFMQSKTVKLESKEVVKLNIPLQESGLVKGHIVFNKGNELFEFSVNKLVNNLSIVATGKSGNIIEARTDERGQFVLFLPPGMYVLSVSGLPGNVEAVNDKQTIQVSVNTTVENLSFTLKAKEKKVEIKRFGG